MITVEWLTEEHLHYMPLPKGLDTRAYFTPGSAGFAVKEFELPVFAGGIVNLQWRRGEAWILPTPWFRTNLKTSFSLMKKYIPHIAFEYGFRRVQASCVAKTSTILFYHLGFQFEGALAGYGPNGETCDMWSRIFEVNP